MGHTRLDLIVVPDAPDEVWPRPAVDSVMSELRQREVLDEDGRPGPGAGALVHGGFDRVWFERSPRLVFYGNQVGGFRVGCPACSTNVAGPFGVALAAWRTGGDRVLACPRCEAVTALESLAFAPPAGFARTALRIADAGSAALAPGAAERLTSHLGALRVVLRRVN